MQSIFNKHVASQISVVLIITFLVINPLGASDENRWGISAGSAYSMPVGGLSDWFKPAFTHGLGMGRMNSNGWYIEAMVAYTGFQNENLSGYPKGRLDLSLQHLGFILNSKYYLKKPSRLKPYWNIGGGIYYWEGVRGRIEADINKEPVIPLIEELTLEEWNWGFRTGLGIEWSLPAGITIDAAAFYRFVVGDLWPTLQPHIELEGVSGFQSVNLEIRVRYDFN